MKLYHMPQSRSLRVRWMLEEIGVPYEIVQKSMHDGSLKTPEYLKLHPHGAVPTLQDGDLTIYESGAICLYLADKYPDAKLAPPISSPQRGLYYQWVLYAIATIEPPILKVFLNTIQLPEAERQPKVAEEGRTQFKAVCDVVTNALKGKQYLLGDQFTAADIMVGGTLGWASMMGLLADHPALQEYVQRINQRPAAQRANA